MGTNVLYIFLGITLEMFPEISKRISNSLQGKGIMMEKTLFVLMDVLSIIGKTNLE